PLDPRARAGLPDDLRFHLALGYRLVLVLEEPRCAESRGAPAVRPQAPGLAHLPEDHALEFALAAHRAPRPVAPRPRRVGDPGHRRAARRSGALPGVLSARGADRAR